MEAQCVCHCDSPMSGLRRWLCAKFASSGMYHTLCEDIPIAVFSIIVSNVLFAYLSTGFLSFVWATAVSKTCVATMLP